MQWEAAGRSGSIKQLEMDINELDDVLSDIANDLNRKKGQYSLQKSLNEGTLLLLFVLSLSHRFPLLYTISPSPLLHHLSLLPL